MSAVLALLASIAVHVDGRTLMMDRAMLTALPQTAAEAHFHGGVTRCEGPLMADVLRQAGVPQGPELRGKLLASAIVAEGADGYRVLFSLGEIDPMLGRAPVVVALSCNGKPVAEDDGPFRLLAGGDQRGARSVRQLVRLVVTDAPR